MKNDSNQNCHYIYVACITLKNGRKIYAKNYGKRAFRIRIKD